MIRRTYSFGDFIAFVALILLFLLFIWPAYLFDSPILGQWNDWTDDDDRIVSAYSNDDLEERIERNIEELEDAGWDEDDIEDLRADIRDELDDLDDDASRSEVRSAISSAVNNFERNTSSASDNESDDSDSDADSGSDQDSDSDNDRDRNTSTSDDRDSSSEDDSDNDQDRSSSSTQNSDEDEDSDTDGDFTPNMDPDRETFDYVPGGDGYGAVANDPIDPEGESDCIRVWQAANLKNLPWTFVLCEYQVSEPAPGQQWPHPTEFVVSGSGVVEFDLYRDQGAIEQLQSGEWGEWDGNDPYDVANAQNSELGLGWFFDGFNATVCVNDDCKDLTDEVGVLQIDFPKDWDGHYHIELIVEDGYLSMVQGERFTSENNWPLP